MSSNNLTNIVDQLSEATQLLRTNFDKLSAVQQKSARATVSSMSTTLCELIDMELDLYDDKAPNLLRLQELARSAQRSFLRLLPLLAESSLTDRRLAETYAIPFGSKTRTINVFESSSPEEYSMDVRPLFTKFEVATAQLEADLKPVCQEGLKALVNLEKRFGTPGQAEEFEIAEALRRDTGLSQLTRR